MIQHGDRRCPDFRPIDKHAVERYDVRKISAKKSVRVINRIRYMENKIMKKIFLITVLLGITLSTIFVQTTKAATEEFTLRVINHINDKIIITLVEVDQEDPNDPDE